MRDAQTAKTNWLTLLRAGGETDLGAGLVRLATLAAAVHRHEAAREATREATPGGVETIEGGSADGPADDAVVAASGDRFSAARLHTEVHR